MWREYMREYVAFVNKDKWEMNKELDEELIE